MLSQSLSHFTRSQLRVAIFNMSQLQSIHPICIHIAVFCTSSESFSITRDYLYPKSLVVQSYLCMASLIRSLNHAIYHKAWLFFPLSDNSNVLSCMLLFSSRKVFLHCGANFFSPQAHILFYRWLLSHNNNLHTLSCMWRLVATF